MTTEENKALIQRLFEEVFNKGNLAVVDELWIAGREEAGKRATLSLRTAFPDYHRTIEQQIAEGDTVVTRWTARGTHQGVFQSDALGRSISPTGKAIAVPGVSIHRIANGRIVDAWVTGNDTPELWRQIGALPSRD
jgi:predicted ester cyclase